MTGKIILRTHKPVERSTCGVVRISDEAYNKIYQIQVETGLSAKYIVSQMIIQGAELVEVVEERIKK